MFGDRIMGCTPTYIGGTSPWSFPSTALFVEEDAPSPARMLSGVNLLMADAAALELDARNRDAAAVKALQQPERFRGTRAAEAAVHERAAARFRQQAAHLRAQARANRETAAEMLAALKEV